MRNLHHKIIQFILIAYFLIEVNSSFAQYLKFPESNAFWSEYQEDIIIGTGIFQNTYTVFLDGDSIVNGVNYHKIYKSGVEIQYTSQWQYVSTSNYTHVFQVLIREDSSKHIFMKGGGNEILLYDFNLKLNDTLDYTAYRYTLEKGTYVSAIDSIELNSKFVKRYHLSVRNWADDYIVLIEGIGSSFGLLNFTAPPFEHSSNLYCFRSDSLEYIMDPAKCDILGVEENHVMDMIDIFPNPFINDVTIKLNYHNSAKLVILNELGKIVFDNSINKDQRCSFSFLDPGVYFLKININNNIFNKRIIKVK